MAIKSVNGKNVYVIEVEVPTPRTSTGQSFGNLVSDLRWDMFEKIQKDMLRNADVDMQTYKIAAESYNQQRKDLQDQIARLKELKIKASQGEGGSKDNLMKTAMRMAELAERQNRPYLVTTTTKAGEDTYVYGRPGQTPAQALAAGGDEEATLRAKDSRKLATKYGSTATSKKTYQPGYTPEETDALVIYQNLLKQKQKAESDASNAEPGSEQQDVANANVLMLDDEILMLEQKLQGLQAPEYTGTRDFTTAARRGFAQNMGYGGFGIQQRPGKFQSTYYEPEAISVLDKRIANAQNESYRTLYSDVAKRQSSYDKDMASINAKAKEYDDLKKQLESIDPNKEPEKYDQIATQLNTLGNRIINAELYVSRKYDINNKNFKDGKFIITDQEVAEAASRGSKQAVADAQLLGARSVTDREFLGYGSLPEEPPIAKAPRQPRPPMDMYNPPGTDRPDTFGIALPGEAEIPGPESIPRRREVIDIPGAGPYSEPGAQGALPSRGMTREGAAIRYTPSDKVLVPSTTLEGYDIPVGPSSDKNILGAEEMIEGEIADETGASYDETPASRRAAAQREAEFRALLGEDYQQMPRPAGARTPFGRMEPSPRATMPVERRGGEIVPATRRPGGLADRMALRRLGRDMSGVGQPVPMGGGRGDLPPEYDVGSEEDIQFKRGLGSEVKPYLTEDDIQFERGLGSEVKPSQKGFDFEVEDIEIKPVSKAPATRESRRDLYLAKTIKKGIELANRPAKVERLAKTNLPEKDRNKVVPEAIAVVDKIYEINRGKPNAFKLSFDEISRAFANKPKERQQAHEYLVAKDMLEGDKTKPLA